MQAIVLVIILSFAFLTGCSDGSQAGTTGASPDLKLSTINGTCLNLQRVVAQMNQVGFSYPGNVYTRDFQVLDAISNSKYVDALYASSWRDERRMVKGLPELRGLEQTGCESVHFPEFNNIPIPYKIRSYSESHLELEFDRKAYGVALKDLPDVQRESILDFPPAKSWTIKVISPNELTVTSRYQTVPMICVEDRSYEVQETRVYRWSGSATQPADNSAQVNVRYWDRLSTLAGLLPAEAIDETLPIDSALSQAMTESLKARQYELCH